MRCRCHRAAGHLARPDRHPCPLDRDCLPTSLLLLLACILLLLKALHADILCTRLESDVRRLNQRLALLELALPKHPPEQEPTSAATDT